MMLVSKILLHAKQQPNKIAIYDQKKSNFLCDVYG